MQKHEKVIKEVLKKIQPSEEERKKLENLSKQTLKIVNEEAKKHKGKAMLVGSLIRDTWLTNKNEFDVFILFPESLSEKSLEEFGLKIGKKAIERLNGKWKIEYAQHPYVRGNVKGIQIDIVPCYEVKPGKRIKSAVDRTPFHVKYLSKYFPGKLSNEVRLLKQLCTANKIYGADAKTQGFSGFVCELLTIKYGSFLKVLKNAIKWKPGEIIDLENYYEKKDYRKLRRKFKREALILIDPTDKERNAAAAVSSASFYKLKKLAKDFLRNPSPELFFEKKVEPMNERDLILTQMKRRTELLLIVFEPPKVVPDILWPQLRKFAERIENILKEYEFEVLRKDVYTNEKNLAVVLLEMKVSKLPYVEKRVGPLIFDLDDSERFLKKYKNALVGPFIENNMWCAEINRKFVTAREKLIDSLSENEETLKAKGIPNHIAEQIAKKFEIVNENEKIMKLVKKDEDFGRFLRKYFEKESLI